MVRSDPCFVYCLVGELIASAGDDGDDSEGCKHIKLPANHLEKMLETKSLKGCEVKRKFVFKLKIDVARRLLFLINEKSFKLII